MNNSKGFWLCLFWLFPWFMVNPITSKLFPQLQCILSQNKKLPQVSLSAASYVSQSTQRTIPIRYKTQESHFVFDCSNKQKCQAVAVQCDAALVAAQKEGNQEQIKRLEKRLQALNSKNSKRLKTILYQEFDRALAYSAALVQQFSNTIQVYIAHGTAVIVAQKAEVEKDLGMVCSYADVVHDLVTLAKVATGTVRGVCRGIKHTISVEHAKQLINGTAHLVKAMAQRVGEFIELAPLLGDNFASGEQTIAKFEHDNPLAQKVLQEHFNAQFKLLKETSWEKIAEVGAELGTTLLLDLVVFYGAGLAASTAGRTFISEVASILEEGGAAQVTYFTDVAMIGKAAATDGDSLGVVLKELAESEVALAKMGKHPEVVVEGESSIGKAVIEAVKSKTRFEKEAEYFQGLIKAKELELGNEAFVLDKIEQNQVFDKIHEKAVFYKKELDRPIYKISGGYEEACTDFEKLKLLDVNPKPNGDGMIGFMYDGKRVIIRLKSEDGRPTLEFQERINGKTMYIKYRYGEK